MVLQKCLTTLCSHFHFALSCTGYTKWFCSYTAMFFRTLTTDITFHLFYIRSLNFVLLLWLHSYMQYIIISSSSVTAQAGKLKFFGTHPNWVVSYIAYIKFHSPRPIFHSPGQIFTRIGERSSTSFPACSRQNLLCSEFRFVLHTFAFIIGFISMT